MSAPRILLFAKAPEPGAVKTRLVPALGTDGAAVLHQRLLHDLARRLGPGLAPRVYLYHHPPDPGAWLRNFARSHGYVLRPQAGADLGERMCNASLTELAGGVPVILIGADCPDLNAATIDRARQALCEADVVFGPAQDGGYVLLGLNRPIQELFEDMPWGTSQVLAASRRRLRGIGISWRDLSPSWDVDRPKDLQRLRDERPDLFSE